METESSGVWKSAAAALGQGASAALVAVFCYATASRVPSLEESYWAPIAAVVVIYPETGATRKASTDRFLGTAIGSFLGWGCAVWWHHQILLYGIAVLFAVALCYALRLENASRLCAVAVTVITLIPRPDPPHLVAFHRFIEVSYGVACAVAFTTLRDAVRRRWKAGRAGERG